MHKRLIITALILLSSFNLFSINPNTLNVSFSKDGFSVGVAEFSETIYFSTDILLPLSNKGNGYANITVGHSIINNKFYLGGIIGLYSLEPNPDRRISAKFNFGGEISYCHKKDVITSLFVTNNSCVGLKVGIMF
jgi:hypothetical protein